MFRFTDLLILRLTRDCNLNCEYCFMKTKSDFKGERLSFEDFKVVINNIIEQRLKSNRLGYKIEIVFHGGEALLIGKDKLNQYAEYLTNQMQKNNIEFSLGMQSNGTLLDDGFAEILKRWNISISLSFDGINGANNKRKVKQELFEKKFEILKRNNLNYGFIIVAGKHNIDQLDNTKEYLKNITEVHNYKVNVAEDVFDRNIETNIELDGYEFFDRVAKPELENFINGEKIYDWTIKLSLEKTIVSLLYNTSFNVKTGCDGLFCGGATHMIGVNPDLTSHFCDRYDREYEETYICNIKDYDFLGFNQIKRAIDFNKILHENALKTGCDDCSARYMCDGGCTAFHRSKFGYNRIDERIHCHYYKSFYNYVNDNILLILKSFSKNHIAVSYYDCIISERKDMIKFLCQNNIALKLKVKKEKNDVIYKLLIEEKK